MAAVWVIRVFLVKLCVLEKRRGVKNIEFLRSGSPMLYGSACWFTSLHCNRVNWGDGSRKCFMSRSWLPAIARKDLQQPHGTNWLNKAHKNALFIRKKWRARRNMRMKLPWAWAVENLSQYFVVVVVWFILHSHYECFVFRVATV